MLILVDIDLAAADVRLFEEYETRALALLRNQGALLLERLRSADGRREVHLLDFPDPEALERFRADPARKALQELWNRSGAISSLTEVERHAP